MFVLRDKALKFKKDQDFRMSFLGEAVCAVKPGDKVQPGKTVFEGMESEVLESMHLCKELGVRPEEVGKYLLKGDGEILDKGDEIAVRTVSMGMAERVVKAENEGRVSLQRVDSGVVDIIGPASEKSVVAQVSGKVKSVLPSKRMQREVVISVPGYVSKPFVCAGENVSGGLVLIKDGNSVYRVRDIDENECKGRIVVAGRSLNLKLYEAIVEAGAVGVIVGGMSRADFMELGKLSNKKGKYEEAVDKNMAIPVVITEGWGTIPVNQVLMEKLRDDEGGQAYINSEENELLIYDDGGLSGSASSGSVSDGDDEEDADVCEPISGMVVQIWDMPYWGYSGEIVNVMGDEELVQVKLGSGEKVLVKPGGLVVIG